jgi:hypothetical protein
VLAGARQVIASAAAVQFEVALVELYQGEATIGTLFETATALGLELWSISPEFSDLGSGRVLQVNCFFVRP